MSDQKKNEQEIFIVDADIQHVKKFFEHFKIDMPETLSKAIVSFEQNKSIETQSEFRFELAKAMVVVKGKNELLDEVFDKVFDCTTEIGYNLQFERDLEDVIGQDPVQNPKNPDHQDS